MRKYYLIILFSNLSIIGTAQNSFFIGSEAGGILQRYHYENDKNVTSTQTAVSTVLEGILVMHSVHMQLRWDFTRYT